ncbi:MAG: tRNA1Val (adenine37-N6)-methyltransferase [Clostridia bacterium]|nr:tRNA1Val (adenine37-N6)-methyltransferase [Clostridia bacterium]MDN5321554.1 tRNA1Val (adenine37-N6)-methyltransferase [Clostridia bacterium]
MYGLFKKDVIDVVKIKENETVDDLILSGLKIIQKTSSFRFSIDAVLLAHFVTVKKKDKVIDLGTGTGVIPLIISTREKELDLTGIEIQEEMAEMAKRSMLLNNLTDIKIIAGDFRKLGKEFNNKFNLVVSNPPYLPLNQGKISSIPEIALSRHEIKCTLGELMETAARLLKNQGRFTLIHRAERLGQIIALLQKEKLEPKRMRLVHSHFNKPANLVLLESVKGASPSLKVYEPLIIYNQDGSYTNEILNYYFGGEACAT